MSVQSTPDRTVVNLLRYHKPAAFALPAPDERVRLVELKDAIGHATVYRFRAHGIVECGDRLGDDAEYEGHWWRTNPAVYEYLHKNYDEPSLTPCGCSSGVRTVEAGETYTCLDDDCGSRFDRETALEVVEA